MSEISKSYDILVIGGGINGTGIARDAAGRGYSVLLAEMNDLASGTSSAATKLVHGGLRYLEHYEFRLVHESLAEREVLWAAAPHIIRPLRFVLPHHKGLRPAWFLRLGLFVYDHLGGRRLLPPTRTLDLRKNVVGKPLKPGFHIGFEYSDCWVDDARMVVLNARDAVARGAEVRVRTKVAAARRENGAWRVDLEDHDGGRTWSVTAKLLVNAGGPWVDAVINEAMGRNDVRHVRLVKGSHIIVRKLFDHDRCYIFQNGDGRIIFAIPYEGDFTLIGTTDIDYNEPPGKVAISPAEAIYLCAAASEYFAAPVTTDDIVWSYAGVRPLYDDGASAAQEATRDYVIKTDGTASEGAVINVFGGKLTTYRRLAESVLEHVEAVLGPRGAKWTRRAKLPGGDFPATGFADMLANLKADYRGLPATLLQRLAGHYGLDSLKILGLATTMDDLGEVFGGDLTAAEVDYLIDVEWARSAEDILWRRSKLGLMLGPEIASKLEAYIEKRRKGARVVVE